MCARLRLLFASFAILVVLGPPTLAQVKIYKWTDKEGVVHFSNSEVPSEYAPQAQVHIMRVSTPSASDTAVPLVILDGDASKKYVRASLEGSTTRDLLMIVDTGAQITTIDQQLAEELELERLGDANLTGVTGSARGWIGRLPKLTIGSLEVQDLRVMVAPTSFRLLGMDVLERLKLSVSPRSLDHAR